MVSLDILMTFYLAWNQLALKFQSTFSTRPNPAWSQVNSPHFFQTREPPFPPLLLNLQWSFSSETNQQFQVKFQRTLKISQGEHIHYEKLHSSQFRHKTEANPFKFTPYPLKKTPQTTHPSR